MPFLIPYGAIYDFTLLFRMCGEVSFMCGIGIWLCGL